MLTRARTYAARGIRLCQPCVAIDLEVFRPDSSRACMIVPGPYLLWPDNDEPGYGIGAARE